MSRKGRKRRSSGGIDLMRAVLRRRGWHPHDDGWAHPRLGWVWPEGMAMRLERDRSAGDEQAIGLLGPLPPRRNVIAGSGTA